ncbi:hypothetical protein [Jutongia sp.]|uniref:hypothetical protein n=1 Tax=Jutongia sp. TaxID=2944204 RepID=UPI003078FCD2
MKWLQYRLDICTGRYYDDVDLKIKEAKQMDSCDSRSQSTYMDGRGLDYISSVC